MSSNHARFSPNLVRDAKRVVRGEHWLLVSRLLASRDVSRRRPIVAVVPGQAAAEEIASVRAAMSGAYIVAIDRDPVAVQAARDAGADEVHEADLSEIVRIAGDRKFDAVRLDLCTQATPELKSLIALSRRTISPGALLMACFSYGRDVSEFYVATARGGFLLDDPRRDADVLPEGIAGRVRYLGSKAASAVSILLYRGNAMPMCEVMWSQQRRAACVLCGGRAYAGMHNDRTGHEYEPEMPVPMRVRDDDLRIAVLQAEDDVDRSALYATPATRIAAWRAAQTRRDAASSVLTSPPASRVVASRQ